MMIKIFLISACVAASANAGWEWNDNNQSGSRNRRNANSYSQNFANIPAMPNFYNLFPAKFNFRDIKFPKMPVINISPEDIASNKDPEYHGMSMVTINGETVVTVNDGGNVKTCTVPAGSSQEEITAILAGTASNN